MTRNFEDYMKDMQNHYRTEPETMYSLPIDQAQISFTTPSPIPEIDQVVADLRIGLDRIKTAQLEQIETAKASFQSGNEQLFRQQMEDSRKRLKAEVQTQIDATYDKLIKIGKKHSESQIAILQATNAVNALVNKAVSDIDNVISNTFGVITNPVDITLKGAETVIKTVSNVLGKITNAIGSIFHR
ncbi:hypothetical protein KFU94_60580 [Chloroflexi bacterium TSY]|nr:hypothetical protein [Chloroflexi bacterium TSY]